MGKTCVRSGLMLGLLLGAAACERTPEQNTASAEKSAKDNVDKGATSAEALGALLAAEGWARETPPGATTGGAYLTIVNGMHNGDVLESADAAFAEKTQIHRSVEESGVARMQPIDKGLPIPAGATLKLEPGGLHIMFMGLKEPLKTGQMKMITLTFRQAGQKRVPIIVRPMTASGLASGDMEAGHSDSRDDAMGGHDMPDHDMSGHDMNGEADHGGS